MSDVLSRCITVSRRKPDVTHRVSHVGDVDDVCSCCINFLVISDEDVPMCTISPLFVSQMNQDLAISPESPPVDDGLSSEEEERLVGSPVKKVSLSSQLSTRSVSPFSQSNSEKEFNRMVRLDKPAPSQSRG